MNPNFRNFALWVIIFLLVLALVTLFQNPGHRGGGGDIAYSQLLTDADSGRITNVVISGQEISGTYSDGRTFTTYAPYDPLLVQKLSQKLASQRGLAIDYRVVPGANHFFQDKVEVLTSHVEGYLSKVRQRALETA